MSDFVKVGSKKDFEESKTTQVKVNGEDVCVANIGNNLYAYEDSCTHAAALISGCSIEDNQVSCPLHGAKFDIITGAAKTLPATEALKKHEVKVEGDDVYIRLNDE